MGGGKSKQPAQTPRPKQLAPKSSKPKLTPKPKTKKTTTLTTERAKPTSTAALELTSTRLERSEVALETTNLSNKTSTVVLATTTTTFTPVFTNSTHNGFELGMEEMLFYGSLLVIFVIILFVVVLVLKICCSKPKHAKQSFEEEIEGERRVSAQDELEMTAISNSCIVRNNIDNITYGLLPCHESRSNSVTRSNSSQTCVPTDQLQLGNPVYDFDER